MNLSHIAISLCTITLSCVRHSFIIDGIVHTWWHKNPFKTNILYNIISHWKLYHIIMYHKKVYYFENVYYKKKYIESESGTLSFKIDNLCKITHYFWNDGSINSFCRYWLLTKNKQRTNKQNMQFVMSFPRDFIIASAPVLYHYRHCQKWCVASHQNHFLSTQIYTHSFFTLY